MKQAINSLAAEGQNKADGRVVPRKRMNEDPVTQTDHIFAVGNVDLCIKSGTKLSECLEDVSMFTSGVRRILVEMVRDRPDTLQEIDPEVIWAMSHMLNLVKGINDAALKGLLASEFTSVAGAKAVAGAA